MIKVIHMIRRKPHLTHAQFREHFERSHAAMALRFCGHLFKEYRRNYVDVAFTGGDSRVEGSGYGPVEWHWDLLSEWIVESEDDLNEIYRIMESSECKALFRDDEDRFIDRAENVTMPVVVHDVGVKFDPRGTVFDTPSGEPSWEGWENWTPDLTSARESK